MHAAASWHTCLVQCLQLELGLHQKLWHLQVYNSPAQTSRQGDTMLPALGCAACVQETWRSHLEAGLYSKHFCCGSSPYQRKALASWQHC